VFAGEKREKCDCCVPHFFVLRQQIQRPSVLEKSTCVRRLKDVSRLNVKLTPGLSRCVYTGRRRARQKLAAKLKS